MRVSDHRIRDFVGGEDFSAWDALVNRSCNGTFLHTQSYLSYHGDKFIDRSKVIEDARGHMVGVLPAAHDPDSAGRIVSHPGITYGGLVHDGTIRGGAMISVLRAAIEDFSRSGCTSFRYKVIPRIFHRVPSSDDVYALFRLGATLYRCDLSSTIDLANRLPIHRMRRKRQRRASLSGVQVVWGWDYLSAFWTILNDNLGSRFGVQPVHTEDQILDLAKRFPDNIRQVTALMDGEVIAGGIAYCSPPTFHLQYSSANDLGREFGGLDCLVEACIAAARDEQYRFFSFGNSTRSEGRFLNETLLDFKLSFGGGTDVYEHFELDLM